MFSLKQFEFDPNQNFDPSNNTKNWWMATRKKPVNFAGIVLPGLFSTSGYTLQMLGVFTILILEGATTWFGATQGVAYITILITIAIDTSIALIVHRSRKNICELRNRLVVERGSVMTENLSRKIRKARFWNGVGYFMIIVLGALKFYLFLDAYVEFDIIALAALVFYLLGAVLHIYCTGYFVYTSHFNYLINKEYSRFVASNGVEFAYSEEPLLQEIDLEKSNLQPLEKTEGNQSIIKKDGKFYFRTFGVLTDRELAALIGVQQSDIVRSIVAREGVRVQLIILNSNFKSKAA